MAGRVGIVAVAQTKFEGKKLDEHTAELMYDVTRDVMGQTGLEFKEGSIDSTVAASYDLLSGPAGAYMFLGYVVGAYQREDERVLEDGALAVYYGAMQILSGHCDTVLLVAYTKESAIDKNLYEWVGMDQIYQRRVGLDFVSAAGLQAMRYTTKYGITPEQCAKVVVKALPDQEVPLLCMHPENGEGIEIALNDQILHSMCRLLSDCAKQADWELKLDFGEAEQFLPKQGLN